MSLVIFKPKKASPVLPEKLELDPNNPSILELVLKYVYSETLPGTASLKDRTMTLQETVQMKFSIDWWYKAVKKQKERKILRFKIFQGDEIEEPDEVELALMHFSDLIVKKEQNDQRLRRRICLFKEHKLDYRKVYRLPGSHTAEDYERGALALARFNRQNPDLV